MMLPQFQPAYGFMYPGSQMMPMPMQAPGMGMPSHMAGQHGMMGEGGAGHQQRGGRGSVNVFYKTRMCNKWRSGSCPFGDKCTYAHGQHELRRVPPEVLAQVERDQAMQQQQESVLHHEVNNKAKHAAEDEENEPKSKSQLYYKTRLCIRFMQSGYCVKGNSCTFAHGYEDLRLLGQQQPQSPNEPRPDGDGENDEDGIDTSDDISAEQRRARAMSAVAGVGNAGDSADAEDVRQATASIEEGTAFRGGPYADSAEDFVPD